MPEVPHVLGPTHSQVWSAQTQYYTTALYCLLTAAQKTGIEYILLLFPQRARDISRHLSNCVFLAASMILFKCLFQSNFKATNHSPFLLPLRVQLCVSWSLKLERAVITILVVWTNVGSSCFCINWISFLIFTCFLPLSFPNPCSSNVPHSSWHKYLTHNAEGW